MVQAAGRVALRELPCRLVVSAEGSATAFSRDLCLLPRFAMTWATRWATTDAGSGAAGFCGDAELDACYEGRARHPVFVALS